MFGVSAWVVSVARCGFWKQHFKQIIPAAGRRGAYIYDAAGTAGQRRSGAAAIIKYRMTTGTVRQETIGWASTCSTLNAQLRGILYALQHARRTIGKTAHVYVATASREALTAIQEGQVGRKGRETLHKVADGIRDLESVDHQVLPSAR